MEDHVLLAEALEMTLSSEGFDVRRIEPADDGMSTALLLSTILRTRPEIVLLDLDLGRSGDGVRLIGPLAHAGVRVVVVTASGDRARWGECLRHGARTVLSKGRPLREVVATVRRVHEGFPAMAPAERDHLLRLFSEQRRAVEELNTRLERLTRREQQVLDQLVSGRTVREIAEQAVVAEATVRTQVKSILAKLEVSSQLAAVGIAHRAGWRLSRT
ncbi:LuxR C-terminal-related transcriptional regulator [Nocardioides sp. CFH 31398]|uniref:LuxR C-terminal-related transcriptional regulator n=1 Tax=Nocardioides sp. CFH 31398 TaxID=2919579 RepID=UPI001F06F979|nr:response regulator transcription factor [Nocardioides sp. CFH 31398]MCH1867529.1 response regulator transcription factor [Nocardioides sp. CFH 31398]